MYTQRLSDSSCITLYIYQERRSAVMYLADWNSININNIAYLLM
jgi:hypothetical protein